MDGSGEISEEFWGFLHCDFGLSGRTSAETVLNGITNIRQAELLWTGI